MGNSTASTRGTTLVRLILVTAFAFTSCKGSASSPSTHEDFMPEISMLEVADDAHLPENLVFKCYGDGPPRSAATCRVSTQGHCHDVGHEHATCFEQRTALCEWHGSESSQMLECYPDKAACESPALLDRRSPCSEMYAKSLVADVTIARRRVVSK